MTDYPERINISPVHRQKREDDFYLVDREAFPNRGAEYTRTDHALALVAAAYEDCWEQGKHAGRFAPDVPDDAQAALERTLHDTKTEWCSKGYKAGKRKARNEALKEALQRIADLERGRNQDIDEGHEQAYRTIEALITEDQSDE